MRKQLEDLLADAKQGSPEAIEALVYQDNLWKADAIEPTITDEEAEALLKTIADLAIQGRDSDPDALIRLGHCFYEGKLVEQDRLAAYRCWSNAYEIAEHRTGGLVGTMVGQTSASASLRTRDLAAKYLDQIRQELQQAGQLPETPQPGQLYDISDLRSRI